MRQYLKDCLLEVESILNRAIVCQWYQAVVEVFVEKINMELSIKIHCYYQREENGKYFDVIYDGIKGDDGKVYLFNETLYDDFIIDLKDFVYECYEDGKNWKLMVLKVKNGQRYTVDFTYDL